MERSAFERRLCRRNPKLGEVRRGRSPLRLSSAELPPAQPGSGGGSEGAVEAPFDLAADVELALENGAHGRRGGRLLQSSTSEERHDEAVAERWEPALVDEARRLEAGPRAHREAVEVN